MGKLSKIKRAFNNATETKKKDIWFYGHGCKFLDNGRVEFTLYYPARNSYRRYIAKMAEEWMVNTYGHDGEVALSD